MTKPAAREYTLLAGIGLAWGSQFLFNEVAIRSFSPLAVATGRVCIGLLTLSAILWLWPKLGQLANGAAFVQPWGAYFSVGIFEAILPCFLLPWGQRQVDSSLAAILFATIPIFTLALAPILIRSERWTISSALAVAIGFTGIVVSMFPHVGGNASANLAGSLAILGAALSFAVSLILMKRLPAIPPILAMRNIFLTAAPIMIVILLAAERPWQTLDPSSITTKSWAALVALGIVCGAVAYVLNIELVWRCGPVFASLANYVVTLTGVFLGAAVLRERLQLTDYAGLALLLVALAITQFPSQKNSA